MKQQGAMPLDGRLPAHAEWVLLQTLADDLRPYIDYNDYKVISDICQKRDVQRYLGLGQYWGLRSIDPTHHCSTVARDASLYLLSSLLAKYQFSGANLEQVTLDTFLAYERHCREYNRDGYRALTWSDDPGTQRAYGRMLEFIRMVIGDYPTWSTLYGHMRHGPGRTVKLNAKYGNRYYKYHTYPYDVTKSAIPLARRAIAEDSRWRRALEESFNCDFSEIADEQIFRVVPGNLVLFVPKDAKTLRTIACEPSLNMYLQLGVDGFIRQRLKKFGVDIDDQSINQNYAKIGSLDNSLATLDLKGASDTVTMRLVEKLMPYKWLVLLDQLRCDVGLLPNGESIRYEKLSSMGNGYTFAIETLIFAAVVYAAGGDLGVNSSVYGDDIIVPSAICHDTIRLLQHCGFMVNTDKSFFTSTFTRESCGADYLRGINIRPVYIKKPLVETDIFGVNTLHNKIMRWWDCHIGLGDPQVLKTLVSWIPNKYLCFGPPNAEELSTYIAVRKPWKRTDHYGFIHDAVIARPVVVNREIDYDNWYYLLLLHDLKTCEGDGGTRFTVTLRNQYVAQYSRGTRRCFAWPETYDITP